jgi:hypothetical protein
MIGRAGYAVPKCPPTTTLSSAGDELTLNFAKELMVKENLGKGDVTDYLSISFSCTDFAVHIFGPSSI